MGEAVGEAAGEAAAEAAGEAAGEAAEAERQRLKLVVGSDWQWSLHAQTFSGNYWTLTAQM